MDIFMFGVGVLAGLMFGFAIGVFHMGSRKQMGTIFIDDTNQGSPDVYLELATDWYAVCDKEFVVFAIEDLSQK